MNNYFENKTILLISPETWGPVKVSKHHYANYLAKANQVYFFNPSLPAKIRFGKFKVQFEKISPGLTLVSYSNVLPRLNGLPKFIQKLVYKYQAKKIQKAIKKEIDIVWTFDPYRYWDQKVWKANYRIYHSVDVHFSKGFENIMAQTSDCVFINSEILRNNLEMSNPKVFKINHGADIDQLSQNPNKKIQLPGENQLKAGLVGNFNHNIDFDLIVQIAKLNPDIDFTMIGPYQSNNLGITGNDIFDQITEIKKLPNVFFIGSINSDLIKTYLNTLDINLVLYKESKTWSKNNTTLDGIIINPHKIMAYLYSGKLIVSSYIFEYSEGYNELILMSNKNAELPEIIKQAALNIKHYNGEPLMRQRRQIALDNSYPNQIEKISSILQSNHKN